MGCRQSSPVVPCFGDEVACSICLEVRTTAEDAFMPCGHVFHKDCIAKWVAVGKSSCPICRANIPNTRGRGLERSPRPRPSPSPRPSPRLRPRDSPRPRSRDIRGDGDAALAMLLLENELLARRMRQLRQLREISASAWPEWA